MALIELNHIKKDYDLGLSKVPALRDIHISLERGEFVRVPGQAVLETVRQARRAEPTVATGRRPAAVHSAARTAV